LQHAAYGNDFSLLIVAVSLADRARQAQATAVIMDSREAPVREAARAKAQVDAAKAEADKTRTTNKTTFQP
jgi:folate-dependent phosphoribosylglycinamide formyltransferase PurN